MFSAAKGNLIGSIIMFFLAVFFGLLLIVVSNQYNSATHTYSGTKCLELTYQGYESKYTYKYGREYAIKTEELDKPIYISTLTSSFCDVSKDILANAALGEKFIAYVVSTVNNDKYSYEIIEMKFVSGEIALSMADYNKGHQKNAVIGFIAIPIMTMVCLASSIICFISFKRNKQILD